MSKPTKDYQKDCRTLESCLAQMKEVLGHPGFRIERFKIEAITATGATLKLSFDKKDVGQAHSVEVT